MIGAIGGDSGHYFLLLIFSISMTFLNLFTLFEVRLMLTPKIDLLDIFHSFANILLSILGLSFVLVIRKIERLELLCGPKPIIVIDNCDDEEVNEQTIDGIVVKPSTSFQE